MKTLNRFFTNTATVICVTSLAFGQTTPGPIRAEKLLPTGERYTATVPDTLEYALNVFGTSEDLQFQKNATNRIASADVMWGGKVLLPNMPVDQLLGLEARLPKIRELFESMPTLAGSRRCHHHGWGWTC